LLGVCGVIDKVVRWWCPISSILRHWNIYIYNLLCSAWRWLL